MKSEVCLPPNKHDVTQPFIAANKAKREMKAKTTDALRKMNSA
jgi:hypothetical protein